MRPSNKTLGCFTKSFFYRERTSIAEIRKLQLKEELAKNVRLPWAGIGLSGGGIRSAALSLGVLQALAENDLLKRFDYLSSVSGGGYLAGALQWWWHDGKREDDAQKQPRFGTGPSDFPYGSAHAASSSPPHEADPARDNLSFLRSYSAYLTPGDGLNVGSMAVVLFRTIAISLFIWIPLLGGAFTLLHAIDAAWLEPIAVKYSAYNPFGSYINARWLEADGCQPGSVCELDYRAVYLLFFYISSGLLALFFLSACVFAFVSRAPQSGGARRIVPTFSVALIITGFVIYKLWPPRDQFDENTAVVVGLLVLLSLVLITVIWAELRTPHSVNASYWLRRAFEIWSGKILIFIFIPIVLATVPLLPYRLDGKLGTVSWLIGLLSGVGSALYGYYTFLKSIVPGFAAQIAATIGSIVYLYTTLVLAYVLSIIWIGYSFGNDWSYGVETLQLAFCIALSLGVWANINYVGLHRFYRDRLMEAFMPTDSAVAAKRSKDSPVADNLLVSDLFRTENGKNYYPRPYPLINTNVILTNDPDRRVSGRGGDNFVISPLFVGSATTGWQDTKAYVTAKGPLTLASSIAASGAAVTANAGAIGAGITTNPFVSAAMSVLNIRLGLWVPNPCRTNLIWIKSIPTFLYPGLVSNIFSRHSRKAHFLELTDGGHFENLGLYELVRRRLPIVLIIDAEADPTISLSSFVSATNRIEEDFQTRIVFSKNENKGPERLIMRDVKGYPVGLREADAPYLVARIAYPKGKNGVLIYLKSTVIKEMDFRTAGYLAGNPSFPHQSTVDQFFDADQFDAYRLLGYEAACRMITELNLPATMTSVDAILDQFDETEASEEE